MKLAESMERAALSMRRFAATVDHVAKQGRLRWMSTHFATPTWKRPVYRLMADLDAWWWARRRYRNVR